MGRKLTSFVAVLLVLGLLLFTPAQAFAAVSNWQQSATMTPRSDNDYGSSSFQQSLNNLKATGANYVTLVIPWYQSSKWGTDIHRGWNTPTDQSLINAINYAHSIGMKVTIVVHMEAYDTNWRAEINPSDRATWFANYQKVLLHYAGIAQTHGVEQFILGAEMINMASDYANPTNSTYWRPMIDKVRAAYSGKLSYSAQRGYLEKNDWYNEQDNIKFWDKLDYLGLSAYYELGYHTPNPTMTDVINTWYWVEMNLVSPFQQQHNKPVIFTEIGYRSATGTNQAPWDWTRGGSYDPALQSKMYEALLSFWDQYPYFQGVHLWNWSTDPNYGGQGNTDYTPQNKPVIDVMKKWFGGDNNTNPDPVEPPPPVNAAITVNGSINPNEPKVNQSLELTASINSNTSLNDVIIDLEVYNSNDQKIHQHFLSGQSLIANTPKSFKMNWSPNSVGTYKFKVGVFNNNWSKAYVWNGNVLTFNVTDTLVQPPANASYAISATTNPIEPKKDQSTTITTSVKSSVNVNDVIVDIEVYDQNNQRVLQKFYSGQNLTSTAKNFDAMFTPNSAGTYTIMVGIFNNNWSSNLHWNSNVKKFSVGTDVVVNPPPQQSNELQIINPTDGSSINGVLPFRAKYGSIALNNYKMYWKVDGGQLNEMGNSNDYKEGLVDVSGWWWNNNGPYKVTFVAKDNNGNSLGEKTVSINIAR